MLHLETYVNQIQLTNIIQTKTKMLILYAFWEVCNHCEGAE
jgi:hypothetical protein